MPTMKKYDVIVVGAGHAGIEASFAAAKLGSSVLLLTLDINGIGKLSCNPAVGGVSKGHLVKETDALGGLIAKITDECALGFRFLNRSKGKAVWATRAQVDRFSYPRIARRYLENQSNIDILQAKARKILIKGKRLEGIETNFGQFFGAKAVIICAGTFLKSIIHIGLNSFSGGRLHEESSDDLFESIKSSGISTKHFKTGTCARLDKRSLDFSKMTEQPPEYDVDPFSFSNKTIPSNQLSCFITYTNSNTHKVILKNLKYSPLYTGKIKAQGVRYCPSLEDKVVRFCDKERHQVFIEPEARESVEVYPNGISTSLPFKAQIDFIRTIEGLKNAVILRPGYGIEHGLIDARQLKPTLEAEVLEGLYFAGQVNGTTGYEEAAAQGLIAGVNAALKIQRKKPFILRREEAFIGVLIDDLTSKGVDEPYRMFTSRCEFRLSLRESNADVRLTPFAYKLRLVGKEDYERMIAKKSMIENQIKKLRSQKVVFDGRKITLFDMLRRPKVSYDEAEKIIGEKLNGAIARREVEIQVKYGGFLHREQIWLRELKNLDCIKIPKIDFETVPSLSKEVVEKLKKFKPNTLGEALKISGMTPAAILNIYTFMKKKRLKPVKTDKRRVKR
ncbi:MAG: tRNA uridine-5-carboxymethylaminomethyl(34) synthesis enzyme MnmG [Candidatus Omnitrophota bacterium]|nr:MAG: tRNA uridine-5-carboxymethylaminomethyl(34) synthesis enzyme MnmG [Candidatus Omnitrophota bacterium]